MSRRSNIKCAGYDWYPSHVSYYPHKLSDDDLEAFLEGWNQAAVMRVGEEEELEREEYEKMRDWFERWEYLKSKYEGELE